MQHCLLRVKTHNNRDLDDDAFVEEVMDRLMTDYPQVHGYTYERVNDRTINILIYGDIEIIPGEQT